MEGIIDLAFKEPDGWVLADWKTDVVEDSAVLEARRTLYQLQLDLYVEAWEALTGEPVKERLLMFLADRR